MRAFDVFVFFHCTFMLLQCFIEYFDALHLSLGVNCWFAWSGCPYTCLADGPISQRLSSVENRLQLLLYLVTELQALRMVAVNKPQLLAGKATKQLMSVSFAVLYCIVFSSVSYFWGCSVLSLNKSWRAEKLRQYLVILARRMPVWIFFVFNTWILLIH